MCKKLRNRWILGLFGYLSLRNCLFGPLGTGPQGLFLAGLVASGQPLRTHAHKGRAKGCLQSMMPLHTQKKPVCRWAQWPFLVQRPIKLGGLKKKSQQTTRFLYTYAQPQIFLLGLRNYNLAKDIGHVVAIIQ